MTRAGTLTVTIVGKPDASSDAAIARLFELWLRQQHPGTTWAISAPPAKADIERAA